MLFRKILRNTLRLLCGSGFNAAMGLAAAAITARTLGLEQYGIFAFIMAYELIIGQLLSFNAWQAVITFGSTACRDQDETALGQLIKTALLLDLAGGSAAFFLAWLLCDAVVTMLGWPQTVAATMRIYCLILLFRSTGAATGALRLLGRFDLLALTIVSTSLLRLLGSFAAAASGLPLHGFVMVYLVTAVSGQLLTAAAAGHAIGWRRTARFLARPAGDATRKFPGLWKYVWTTNLHATIKMLTREADQLIVAIVASPAGLGLLRVARQFARILPLATDPLYQSVFPELSRLHAEGDRAEFMALIRKTSVFGLIVGLTGSAAFLVFGRQIIVMAFGPQYAEAHTTAMIFMLALVIALAALPLQPALLAVGKPEVSFKINLLSTIIYLAVLLPVTRSYGINGAAAAYVLYYIAWAGLMRFDLSRHLKNP